MFSLKSNEIFSVRKVLNNCFLKFGLLFLLLAASLSCTNVENKEWHTSSVQNNKIATLTAYSYKKIGDKLEKELLSKEKYNYDAMGHLRESVTFKGTAEIDYKRIIERKDNEGRPTKTVFYDKKGSAFQVDLFEYNEKGKLTEAISRKQNGMLRKRFRFAYDPRGRKIEETEYDENNALSGKEVLAYNGEDQLVEQKLFDKDNNLRKVHQRSYFDRGNNVEIVTRDSQKKLIMKKVLWFGNKGRVLKESIYYGDAETPEEIEYQYEFDNQARVSRERTFLVDDSARTPLSETVYEYAK